MDDQDEKLDGLYYRTKNQAEAGGMRLEDTMRCIFGWKGEGEITVCEFKQFMSTSGQFGDSFCEDPPPSYSEAIDVTGPNVSAIDGVDVVIGQKWSGEDSYGQILDKIDENRLSEEVNEGISKDTKESTKDREDDELERWPMAKRMLSFRSSGEKTPARTGGEETRTRRQSLI
jgi:hypothetical protein